MNAAAALRRLSRPPRPRLNNLTSGIRIGVGVALVSMVIAVAARVARVVMSRRDNSTATAAAATSGSHGVFFSTSARRFRAWLLERSIDRARDLHALHNGSLLVDELSLSASSQQLVRRAERTRNHLLDSHQLAIFERRVANDAYVYINDENAKGPLLLPASPLGTRVAMGFRATDDDRDKDEKKSAHAIAYEEVDVDRGTERTYAMVYRRYDRDRLIAYTFPLSGSSRAGAVTASKMTVPDEEDAEEGGMTRILLSVTMLYALMLGLLYVYPGTLVLRTRLSAICAHRPGLFVATYVAFGAFVALLVSAHLRRIIAQPLLYVDRHSSDTRLKATMHMLYTMRIVGLTACAMVLAFSFFAEREGASAYIIPPIGFAVAMVMFTLYNYIQSEQLTSAVVIQMQYDIVATFVTMCLITLLWVMVVYLLDFSLVNQSTSEPVNK